MIPSFIKTRAQSRPYLATYLRDHVAASVAVGELFERSTQAQSDARIGQELAPLAAQAREDHAALCALLEELGVPRSAWRERLGSLAEKAGRLKPNGGLLRRSPLSDVLELEALGVALHARRLMWLTLHQLAESDDRLNPYQLELLATRAKDQRTRLRELQLAAATPLVDRPAAPGSAS